MRVYVKCFATLVNKDACDYRQRQAYDLADGQTVAHLAERAGVAGEDVKIAFVNNRKAPLEAELFDGDRVGLVPAVGGM